MAPSAGRDYDALLPRVTRAGDPAGRMRALVDLAWEALHPAGVSWLGFYLHEGADELVLGPMRDKPACSPIGLHGACGRAFRERAGLIVGDVSVLGAAYVACDPRDRSELVIPLLDEAGACYGVFDVDSHDQRAFSRRDYDGLLALLMAAGLTRVPASPPAEL